MATVTFEAAQCNNHTAWANYLYDDVSGICNRVEWVNTQPNTVRFFVNQPDGTPIVDGFIAPAGQAPVGSELPAVGGRNLTGNQRFNFFDENARPGINLAGRD